jgi:Protein of unknown function (DUF992)
MHHGLAPRAGPTRWAWPARYSSLLLPPAAQGQRPRVEVGILSRAALAPTEAILTSSKYLRGRFQRRGGDEFYRGRIGPPRLGHRQHRQTAVAWEVLADRQAAGARTQWRVRRHWRGGNGGHGIGANPLIGGSRRNFILQLCACRPRGASTSRRGVHARGASRRLMPSAAALCCPAPAAARQSAPNAKVRLPPARAGSEVLGSIARRRSHELKISR